MYRHAHRNRISPSALWHFLYLATHLLSDCMTARGGVILLWFFCFFPFKRFPHLIFNVNFFSLFAFLHKIGTLYSEVYGVCRACKCCKFYANIVTNFLKC